MRKIPLTVALSFTMIAGTIAAPILGIRTHTERPPEMDAITVVETDFENQRFSFVLPRNWRFEPESSGAIVRFHSELSRASISMRFSESLPENVFKSSDALRQFAVPGLAAASVLEEFPVYSGGMEGKGVLFANGTEARARVAVVPLGKGCVSFVLNYRTGDAVGQQTFGSLITSFRRAPTK